MVCPAHILTLEDGTKKMQTVAEHCRNSAGIAAGCLQPVALQKVGYLAGLLHDMGKYTAEYRTYLNRAVAGEPVRVGSVIHTHAAVLFLIEQFHEPSAFTSFEDMSAEILAYAAGAHHGLYDCVDEQHRSGFSHRVAWDERLYSEAKDGFFSQCADEKEIQRCLHRHMNSCCRTYATVQRISDDMQKRSRREA